jgi:type VI secretion system protein ImpE
MALNVDELIETGKLAQAERIQKEACRANPDDPAGWLRMAEIHCYQRNFEKVDKLLRTRLTGSAEAETLRAILDCESQYAEDRLQTFGTPPPELLKRIEAAQRLFFENDDTAIDTIDELDETAPYLHGYVDGREFEGIRDSDDLRAPLLDVFHGNRFVWVAFRQIRKLRIHPAATQLDHLYRPATLWLHDGTETAIRIPARYPRTHVSRKPLLRVARATDYGEEFGLTVGLGLRTFLIGEEELPLGDFTQLEFRRMPLL